MKNAFTKFSAVFISALFLCTVPLPQQALAAEGRSKAAAVLYDTDAGDAPAQTTPPDDSDVPTVPFAKPNISPAEGKLDSQLLQLARPELVPKAAVSSGLVPVLNPAELTVPQGTVLDTVKVYVRMKPGADFSALSAVADVEDTDRASNLAVVDVNIANLEALAALDTVQTVKVVHPPIISTGSITSKGDEITHSNALRAATGKNGTGVKIGVISDGAEHFQQAVEANELPAYLGDTTTPHILRNGYTDKHGIQHSGDEGTAMMEIIYDLAPGAEMFFHDCGDSMLAFNNAVKALKDAGCTIICDDVDYTDDNFFEDGPIATYLQDLMKSDNILFVTAAGNMADAHYQGLCKATYGRASDFRTSSSSKLKDLYVDVPPGGSFQAVLQWNDPIGASTNDYDLYASPKNHGSSYTDLVSCYASSCNTQYYTRDPYESLEFVNYSSQTKTVALWVYNSNARTPRTIEIYVFCDGYASVEATNVVTGDSIYGHATLPGVVACAAIDGNPYDNGKLKYRSIEYYSSRGPVTMVDGSIRQNKPDVTGVDGVRVTGTGGFGSQVGGQWLFYGTSAASPHVAAVAALLKSVYPTYKASQIYQMITSCAADMGVTGFDSTYGYGLVDAMAAAFSTVTFNDQGGPAIPSAQLFWNTKVTEPTQPVRTGYTFGGWYKEAACVNPWDFGSSVTANMTLYAKWTINTYTVSFDAQGGGAVSSKLAVYNTTIPAPALPARVGYSFAGWYKDAGYTAAWNFASDRVVSNTTLFAMWNIQSYAVSFDSRGGSAVVPVTAQYGSKITAPAGPSRVGYAFGGWYNDAECTQAWDFATATVDGTQTLFAKWTVITYHVTFDAQGGSGGPAPVAATYGSSIAFPAVPALDGSYFGGWYEGKDFARQWFFSQDKVSGDMTLYARWLSSPPASMVILAAPTSYGSVYVSWNPAPYATGYTVSVATAAKGPWSSLAADSASTGAAYSNLVTNTRYYYKVQAQCLKDGKSYTSDSPVVSVTPLPETPGSAAARSAAYNGITVSWSGVAGATGYEVWRSASAYGRYKRVTTTSSLSYTNKSLTTGAAYYYKVKAYRTVKGKKIYGGFTPATSARPLLSVPAPNPSRVSATSIKLSWGKVSGATKYEILRASADTGIFSPLASTTKNYYTNTGLRTGQPYYYMVRAYRSSGKSWSAFSPVVVMAP